MALPSPKGESVPVVPCDSRNGRDCASASQRGEINAHMTNNSIVVMIAMQRLSQGDQAHIP